MMDRTTMTTNYGAYSNSSDEEEVLEGLSEVDLIDFMSIEESHPYGVLPIGNRFSSFSSSPSSSPSPSTSTSNSTVIAITENIWQQSIMPFLDGSSLSSLIQASRYYYVLGHQPELWRDLVLRNCCQTSINNFVSSWKDTYVYHGLNKNNDKSDRDGDGNVNDDDDGNNVTSISSKSLYKPHQPIRMESVYSDDIYRSHLCRSFAIPKAWLNQKQTTEGGINNKKMVVQRVNVNDITPEQFFTRFENENRPVVIQGAATGKATKKWKKWNYLINNNNNNNTNNQNNSTGKGYGNNNSDRGDITHLSTRLRLKSYRATSGAAPLPGFFTLNAYREYISTQYLEESPLYLFERDAFNNEWWEDFFPQFYEKCPYWDPSAHGHDLLQHLGNDARPDHTWLIIGPKRSGSVFHIDPNATHAWNACITGRKRWIFYPPGQPPPGVFPTADGDEVTLPVSVGEWIMQYWPQHLEQYRTRKIGQSPLECTTYPGDVIFVPHGWWHSVINLDDTNIAITHNYISPSNLGNALKFFAEKQDQISGCRDRKETIKPECMYKEFVKVLRKKQPRYLEKALQQKGWTCQAWKGKERKVSDEDEAVDAVEGSKDKKDLPNNAGKTTHGDGSLSKVSKKKRRLYREPDRVSNFTFSFL